MSLRNRRTILGLGALFAAATASHAHTSGSVPEDIAQALVAWSSTDFTEHGPAVEMVRNVHVRFETQANGEPSYLLCGQFRAEPESEWIHFATIKTDPYEQWIGGSAQSQCERASAASTPSKDLTTALQAELDTARPK